MTQAIEVFQNLATELAQHKQVTETPDNEAYLQANCAEVLQQMANVVAQEPEVAKFYATALTPYHEDYPAGDVAPQDVISRRVARFLSLGLLTNAESARVQEQLADGSYIYEEAKCFFRIFRNQIDPALVPQATYHEDQKDNLVSQPQKPQRTALKSTSSHGIEAAEKAPEQLGHEYDEMVEAYRDHPENRLLARYRRDFAGFKGSLPAAMPSTAATNEDALFVTTMNRFPLLDGLAHEQILARKIQAGMQAHQQLLKNSELTSSERVAFEQAAIEGAGAYLTMYECNLRLVRDIAGKHKPTLAYSLSDMTTEGCIGLRRAIQKYDPEKGFKFSTYASDWISQAITIKRGEVALDLRLPPAAYRKVREIWTRVSLAEKAGLPPLTDEDLNNIGYSPEVIRAARTLREQNRISLDKPTGNETNTTLSDLMPVDVDFDAALTEDFFTQQLHAFAKIANLTEREKIILSLRNGLFMKDVNYSQTAKIGELKNVPLAEFVLQALAGSPPALAQIGKYLGLTSERVRQLSEECNLSILTVQSLQHLTQRLQLDEKEQAAVAMYLARPRLGRLSRSPEERLRNAQACRALELLSLLDEDPQSVMENTINVIQEKYGFSRKTLQKMSLWLTDRFIAPQNPPIYRASSMKPYGLQPHTAKIADAMYAAVLSGAWGSVPEKLQSAA